MVFKVTSTSRARHRGVTLIEMMIAIGIGALVCAAGIATLLFGLRNYEALTNYQILNTKSRTALDIMSRDIRQANGCSTNATFSASSFTLLGTSVTTTNAYTTTYSYNSNAMTLTRTYIETNTQVNVLLSNCTYFAFSYYQRNPTPASFDFFTNTQSAAYCKLIQVDWSCSRNIMGTPVNTQSGESTRMVIRKK